METANETESVLFSYNDVELRWVGLENWTYYMAFNITDKEIDHEFIILTFHGVDTFAEIYLNDEFLGETNNMFLRYQYEVKDILVEVKSLI